MAQSAPVRSELAKADKSTSINSLSSIYYSAKSVEWYTPCEVLDAARQVLATIDLDPASCPRANALVQAKHFFSQADDGLSKEWFGRVWLNPPFGKLGPKFARKLISEYESGSVQAAVFLANANALTSSWFHPLLKYPFCIPKGRVKFWNEHGTGESPGNGSILVYLGTDTDKFSEHFEQFGTVVVPYKRTANESRLGLVA